MHATQLPCRCHQTTGSRQVVSGLIFDKLKDSYPTLMMLQKDEKALPQSRLRRVKLLETSRLDQTTVKMAEMMRVQKPHPDPLLNVFFAGCSNNMEPNCKRTWG
jgi:hypothetical protein